MKQRTADSTGMFLAM